MDEPRPVTSSMRPGARDAAVASCWKTRIRSSVDRTVIAVPSFPAAKALEARRTESYNGFLELIARAKNSGHLREDFVPEDLVILHMANAGVAAATGDTAPDTWRRLVGHMLRPYATPGAPIPVLPEAPASSVLYRAMVRLTRTGSGAA
ncbi:hypothetical protein ACFZCU_42460 [Streptomyces canus]|uniref:hypothetical protein n=1 Tax=Streptomyces canus TaxID=58343 RepID=UPI0036EA1057